MDCSFDVVAAAYQILAPPDRARERAQSWAGDADSVLDVGCGVGDHTARFARPGRRLLGIDPSSEMIARAKASYPRLILL